MAYLNITGSTVVDDPTYRYKMPKMSARTEGRGNGIRTLIANMSEIADALHRPPNLVTKFFGVELGAQSRYEEDVSICADCRSGCRMRFAAQSAVDNAPLPRCSRCRSCPRDLRAGRRPAWRRQQ
jgi:hypothetical protein